MNNPEKITEVTVRNTQFKLFTFNRSLELCARMNYEIENLDFIDGLEEGTIMYDLGACEGRFSIYAALKGIKVFSFEPNKDNFEILQKNIQLNNLEKKVTLFNVGVGETNKQAILQIGQPWPGGHQKVVQHDEVREDLKFSFVGNEVIEIVSLDSLIKSGKLPFPQALKIDIDGSEVPFLKGANETLKNTMLKQIIFELDKGDKNYQWIIQNLENASFKITQSFQVPNEPTLFNIIMKKQ
jgi:FkbM family methyltransferase